VPSWPLRAAAVTGIALPTPTRQPQLRGRSHQRSGTLCVGPRMRSDSRTIAMPDCSRSPYAQPASSVGATMRKIRSRAPGTDAPEWRSTSSDRPLSIFRVWFAVGSDAPMAMTLRASPPGRPLGRRVASPPWQRQCLGFKAAIPWLATSGLPRPEVVFAAQKKNAVAKSQLKHQANIEGIL
jgi:hypothetical protein